MVTRLSAKTIAGEVKAVPSKSYTQRAFAGALLHKGETRIKGFGSSDDEIASISVAKQLGAYIVMLDAAECVVHSNGIVLNQDEIHVGESGLCTRLFTPIVALLDKPVTITGKGTLLNRSFAAMCNSLVDLGVSVEYIGASGHLPIKVKGPLPYKTLKVDASDSSQYLSGLLFALSTVHHTHLHITVQQVVSIPYIDMTLEVLDKFGRKIINHNYQEFSISPNNFTHKPECIIEIEGDWSGAANLLVGAAISGSVKVVNLNSASKQADIAIVDVLRLYGANVSLHLDNIIVESTGEKKSFDFDASHSPDLIPILSVLAATANGISRIKGMQRLHNKESNRVNSVVGLLNALGVSFTLDDDVLMVNGVKSFKSAIVNSFNDHRIVFAAAIASLYCNGEIAISDVSCIAKSYPNFFEDLMKLGVVVKYEN